MRQRVQGALEQIEDAVKKGARLLCRRQAHCRIVGYFLEPTVLDGVPALLLCMREETFAPIAPISTFETEEEAIELANSSPYGLSAYAMTRDLNRIFRLGENN